MTSEDFYPGLYHSADKASLSAQRRYLLAVQFYSYSLVGLPIAAAASGAGKCSATVVVVLLVVSISLSMYLMLTADQRLWYAGRALAESVKTSTWQFVMRTAPYNDDLAAERKFLKTLEGLLSDHKALAKELGGRSSAPPISQGMRQCRALRLQDKKERYLTDRVKEQCRWYSKKSTRNRRAQRNWFIFVWLSLGACILLIALVDDYPQLKFVPIDIFAVVAATAFSWVQTKRFGELSASYALTENEITLAAETVKSASDERSLAAVVDDTENAFSREHTQWRARRNAV